MFEARFRLGVADLVEPEGLADVIDPNELTYVDWLVAGGLLVGGLLVGAGARVLIGRIFRRATASSAHTERLLGRIIQAIILLVAFVYALGSVGVRITPLLGALGIGGIALALAIQPALLNLFSGLIIHAQRPLRIGDEVSTGDIEGQVVDITSRAVIVRSYRGETVFIPNSVVVDREIVNYVRLGRRRTTLVVGVAYGTDVAFARDVIHRAASNVSGVLDQPPPRVYATEFADSSINFDVDVWHDPDEQTRREVRDELVDGIHRALIAAEITIPFPQRTLWFGHPPDEGATS